MNRSDYLAFYRYGGRDVEILLKRKMTGAINQVFTLQENVIVRPVTEPFYSYSVDNGNGVFTLRQCIFDKTYMAEGFLYICERW